jgi:hypothetical protein
MANFRPERRLDALSSVRRERGVERLATHIWELSKRAADEAQLGRVAFAITAPLKVKLQTEPCAKGQS